MFDKLSEYLDNELDEATCKKIEKHVKECVACFVCLQTLKRTVDLCKQTADRPVPEPSQGNCGRLFTTCPKPNPRDNQKRFQEDDPLCADTSCRSLFFKSSRHSDMKSAQRLDVSPFSQ